MLSFCYSTVTKVDPSPPSEKKEWHRFSLRLPFRELVHSNTTLQRHPYGISLFPSSANLPSGKIGLPSLSQTPTLEYKLSRLPKTSIARDVLPASLRSSKTLCYPFRKLLTLDRAITPNKNDHRQVALAVICGFPRSMDFAADRARLSEMRSSTATLTAALLPSSSRVMAAAIWIPHVARCRPEP